VFCSTCIDVKSGVVAPEVIVFDDSVQLDAMNVLSRIIDVYVRQIDNFHLYHWHRQACIPV